MTKDYLSHHGIKGQKWYVRRYQNKDGSLTEEGRNLAKKIYDKHTLIYKFLLSIGVSKEKAEIDCCKIEHVISDETAKCLKNYINKK